MWALEDTGNSHQFLNENIFTLHENRLDEITPMGWGGLGGCWRGYGDLINMKKNHP